MGLRRLTNEEWGFESNCFVCEPRNATGLRIPFHHDDDAGTVVAEFTLGNEFSGAPSYVHGGVTLAVLDEAQGWAAIAIGGKFAVTVETNTRFAKPVFVGSTYVVEARVTKQTDRLIHTEAEVRRSGGDGSSGKACATSSARFAVLSPATAVDAIGKDVSGEHGDLLR